MLILGVKLNDKVNLRAGNGHLLGTVQLIHNKQGNLALAFTADPEILIYREKVDPYLQPKEKPNA